MTPTEQEWLNRVDRAAMYQRRALLKIIAYCQWDEVPIEKISETAKWGIRTADYEVRPREQAS